MFEKCPQKTTESDLVTWPVLYIHMVYSFVMASYPVLVLDSISINSMMQVNVEK